MVQPAMAPSGRMVRSRRGLTPVSSQRAVLEGVWWPLYDRNAFATAQATSVDYFRDPVGTATKTHVDTNMEKSRSLASPKLFYVFGLGITVDPFQVQGTDPGADDDPLVWPVQEFAYRTSIEFFIGEKTYIDIPSFWAPSNYRLEGWITGMNAGGSTEEQHAMLRGKPFLLTKKVLRIFPEQSFGATIIVRRALDLTGAKDVWVTLFGELHREVM